MRYNVRPIVIDNPIHQEITWGVFDDYIKDYDHIHCKEPYPNLIVECICESHAKAIANILNEDEKVRENLS